VSRQDQGPGAPARRGAEICVDKERVRSEPLSRAAAITELAFGSSDYPGSARIPEGTKQSSSAFAVHQRKEKDHGEADRDGRNRRYSTRV
jgi:hypothetical protein